MVSCRDMCAVLAIADNVRCCMRRTALATACSTMLRSLAMRRAEGLSIFLPVIGQPMYTGSQKGCIFFWTSPSADLRCASFCSGIANLVSEAVKREAASDTNLKARPSQCLVITFLALLTSRGLWQDAREAQKLLGHVDRKLVKQARLQRAHALRTQEHSRQRCTCVSLQTVMTSVYGVTFMGARDQIMNRCVARCARCSRSWLTGQHTLQAEGAQGLRAPGGKQGCCHVCSTQGARRAGQHVRQRQERDGLAERVRSRHRTARCACRPPRYSH